MKTISKHNQTEPQRVLEHISVAGPEGEIRYLRFVTRDESNRSGSNFGVDWWRIPVRPKGRLTRWLDRCRSRLGLERQNHPFAHWH